MKLAIASNNAHKLAEIRAILGDRFDEICSLSDLNIHIEIEENGETFLDNALIKARTICRMSGLPALADDSGLCVNALNGAPGVRSARYAGEPCDDDANNAKLLARLHEREREHEPDRSAYFVSVVALCYPDGREISARGETYGAIVDDPRGEGGYGYDPYFLSDDLHLTFAQASAQQKNAVSHRAKALHALLRQL